MRDRERFADVYQRFYRAIFVKCRRLLGDEAAAQEMAQEVFIRAHRKWELFHYGESPLPWLYTIANNLCVNELRRRRVRREHLARLGSDEANSDEMTLLRQIEAKDLVAHLLRRCDAESAAIAIAYYVDELEMAEIAALYCISRKTVGKKLQRFVERLRKVGRRL